MNARLANTRQNKYRKQQFWDDAMSVAIDDGLYQAAPLTRQLIVLRQNHDTNIIS
jgi:hypothetical protein